MTAESEIAFSVTPMGCSRCKDAIGVQWRPEFAWPGYLLNMHRVIVVRNDHRAIVALLGVLGTVLLLLSFAVDMRLFFAAGGLLVLFVALIPVAASRTYDCFCPWSAFVIGILYGCTFPSICMSFDLPNRRFVDQNILLGHRPVFFILPTIMIISTVMFAAIGYFGTPHSRIQQGSRRVIDSNRIFKVCSACVIASSIAFVAFFSVHKGIENGISTKRLNRAAIVGESQSAHTGVLRQFAKLSVFGLFLLAANMGSRLQRNRRQRFSSRALLLGLFLISMLLPFYASSRAGIVWIMIGLAGILYYNHQTLVAPRRFIAIVTVAVLVLFVTVSRNDGLKHKQDMMDRIGRLLLNRHGPDIAVTSHIVGNIPRKLEFQYGKTMLVWLWAPVPRAAVKDKPIVHSGPTIGRKIYSLNGSGVPPGITAELYWNFHWLGLLTGSLLLGILMKSTYQYCKNNAADLSLVAPVYMFAVFPLAFKISTHSFGYGIVMNLVDLAIACLITACASKNWQE